MMPDLRDIWLRRAIVAMAGAFLLGLAPAAAADAPSPLQAAWYEAIGTHSSLDTIDWSTPTRTGRADRIEWAATSAPWEPDAPIDEFALRITGAIRAHAPGEYRFRLDSDEGSRLTIGEHVVIDHDGLHQMTVREGVIELEAGFHPLVVDYFEQMGPAGLILEWMPPGATRWTVVPQTSFADPDARIRVEWFFEDHQIRRFDDVNWDEPALVTWESDIDWANGAEPFIEGGPADLFALRARTRLIVPESGIYRFELGSDDGSRLVINGETIINADRLQSYRPTETQVFLDEGIADIELLFFENQGVSGLILRWQAPTESGLSVVPAESYQSPQHAGRPRVVRWTAQTPVERERTPTP